MLFGTRGRILHCRWVESSSLLTGSMTKAGKGHWMKISPVSLCRAPGMSRAHGFSPGKSCVVESLGATACTSPTVMQLGADLIFNLMIRNANEHLCTVSHECSVAASDITASLEGEQARAVTCDEGYCLIQFTDSITIAGETKLEISVGGSSISGSPYTIILTPGNVKLCHGSMSDIFTPKSL